MENYIEKLADLEKQEQEAFQELNAVKCRLDTILTKKHGILQQVTASLTKTLSHSKRANGIRPSRGKPTNLPGTIGADVCNALANYPNGATLPQLRNAITAARGGVAPSIFGPTLTAMKNRGDIYRENGLWYLQGTPIQNEDAAMKTPQPRAQHLWPYPYPP